MFPISSTDLAKDIGITDTGVRVDTPAQKLICSGRDFIEFSHCPAAYSDFLYVVYRHLYCDIIPETLDIKFDITTLPPLDHRHALARTRGHFHISSGHPAVQYFDIYQVNYGKVAFVVHPPHEEAQVVYVVIATPGDIIFIPPNFGHTLYNLSDTYVAVSNWCTRREHLNYDKVREFRGPLIDITAVCDGYFVVEINPLIQRSNLRLLSVRPRRNDVVAASFCFSSSHIFDWAREGDKLEFLNAPPPSDTWMNELFCNSDIELVLNNKPRNG